MDGIRQNRQGARRETDENLAEQYQEVGGAFDEDDAPYLIISVGCLFHDRVFYKCAELSSAELQFIIIALRCALFSQHS